MPEQQRYQFVATLLPTTPLWALQLHNTISSDPSTEHEGAAQHGSWFPMHIPALECLSAGRTMSSLVGYMPIEDGDLLVFFKAFRLIVEQPLPGTADLVEELFRRLQLVNSLTPRRTYSWVKESALVRINTTLTDYRLWIFKSDHHLFRALLREVVGIDYSTLSNTQRQRVEKLGYGDLNSRIGRTLKQQCEFYGWPLQQMRARRLSKRKWEGPSGNIRSPEDVALELVQEDDEVGVHCEGGSVNTLLKAACLEKLIEVSPFPERGDAIAGSFVNHCQRSPDLREEVTSIIRSSNPAAVSKALDEMAKTDSSIDAPRKVFLLKLFNTFGTNTLAGIADINFRKPYYSAGWPDLTIVGPRGVRFCEVKTSDLLLESQSDFARELATPLGLTCSVVQMTPLAMT
jgi:hypothetical protein